MEVIGDTIINVELSMSDEAKLIYQLVKDQEYIGFLIFKNDLIELEKIENKFFKTIEFDGGSEYKREPHSDWKWIKVQGFEELETLLRQNWFIYECRIFINEINQYKYAITMTDSYEYNNCFCRAIKIKSHKGNITEELMAIVSNSRRGDIL